MAELLPTDPPEVDLGAGCCPFCGEDWEDCDCEEVEAFSGGQGRTAASVERTGDVLLTLMLLAGVLACYLWCWA